MAVPSPNCRFDTFSKYELRELASRLSNDDPIAVEWCVTFFEQETRGVGHGRVRSMMIRRLRYLNLSRVQHERILSAIEWRLETGNFSEQFKDQLRAAIYLDPERTRRIAEKARSSKRDYVRRQGDWILTRAAMMKSAGPDC